MDAEKPVTEADVEEFRQLTEQQLEEAPWTAGVAMHVLRERDALAKRVEELEAKLRRTNSVQLERDDLRAVIARVRDALSDCSLDHSIDAVSAIKAVLPREDGP